MLALLTGPASSGASTAVSGVLVAFAMMFPKQKLYLMFYQLGLRLVGLPLGRRWFPDFSIMAYFDPYAGGGSLTLGTSRVCWGSAILLCGEVFA